MIIENMAMMALTSDRHGSPRTERSAQIILDSVVCHREAYRVWLIQGTRTEGVISSDARPHQLLAPSTHPVMIPRIPLHPFRALVRTDPLDFVVCHREAV